MDALVSVAVPPGRPTRRPARSSGTTLPRAVRPFRWPRLERLGRSQIRLLRRLHSFLPVSLLTGELPDALKARLRELLDEEMRLWLDYANLVAPEKLSRIVVDPTFLAT